MDPFPHVRHTVYPIIHHSPSNPEGRNVAFRLLLGFLRSELPAEGVRECAQQVPPQPHRGFHQEVRNESGSRHSA